MAIFKEEEELNLELIFPDQISEHDTRKRRVSCISIHTRSHKLNTRYIHANFMSAIKHCCTIKFFKFS